MTPEAPSPEPPVSAPVALRRRAPSLPPPRFQTARVIGALILREMGSTYGRSPGGYLWAIISPLGSIGLLALAFSLIVHRPALGSSFILFYATGYLPFDLFSQIASKVGTAVRYSRALLAYPRVSWLDTVIARFILTVLTQTTVFCIVIVTILSMVDTRTVLDIARMFEGFWIMAACGMGMGLLNCLLSGYFPVWERLWAIARTPLLFASGVLFVYDDMPRWVQDIMWWNPLMHGIALMRSGFYPTYHASFVSLPYAFGLPLVVMALVLPLLRNGYRAAFDG